jgi:parallel beta-helix repeat protein
LLLSLGSLKTQSQQGNNTADLLELNSNYIERKIHLNYEPHDSIDIQSDTELANVAVGGDGSFEDPFVLEGWEIETMDMWGIHITQTTKYFVIRNCRISSFDYSEAGIYVTSVGDSTVNITNNVCFNSMFGIWVEDSLNVIVEGNNCSFNYNGIYLDNTGVTIVQNNTCNYNSIGAGIALSDIDTSLIQNNTCNYNDRSGIDIFDPYLNSDIIENICVGNGENGLELIYGRYTDVLDNYFYDNQLEGIYLETSEDCVFAGNNFTNNQNYGIKATWMSDNNVIHHNYFYDNNLGGLSQAYDDSVGNVWYDTGTSEGNYWKNWYNGSYPIDGSAGKFDIYPLDLDAPIIEAVSDFDYIYGFTGNVIEWNVTDLSPDIYFVYKDFEEILSGSWNNSVPIIVDIDGLDVGTHIYQLFLLDGLGRSALDTVIVTVIPVINEYYRKVLVVFLIINSLIPISLLKHKKKIARNKELF